MSTVDGNAAPSDRALAGIGCLCLGLLSFSCQDAVVKLLAGEYSVLQILMLRSITAAPLLALILVWRGGPAAFRTSVPRLHAARSVLMLTAFVSFYVAVSAVPLVDVVALFSAAPLIITALAGPVLGERVGARRWLAVGCGFAGVVVMLRPGSTVFNPVALLGLVAATAYAVGALIARKMGPGESSALVSFFTNATFLVGCGAGLALATGLADPVASTESVSPLRHPFVRPPWPDLALMLATGLVTLAGFLLVPRAYQIAPASVVTPFEYTYLLWAMLIGLVFFDEVPTPTTLTGAALVVAAGVYIARHESQRRSASSGPPATA